MTTERRAKTPHSGKGICRWCGQPVPKGRRSWCSDGCVREYLLRSDPAAMRRHVLERDKGVCALCGFDCLAAERKLEWLRRAARDGSVGWRLQPWGGDPGYQRWHWYAGQRKARATATLKRYAEQLRARGFDVSSSWYSSYGRRSLWDADHIVPVVEGGGGCGPENIRTLCQPCHKAETAALAARRARAKRPQLGLLG